MKFISPSNIVATLIGLFLLFSVLNVQAQDVYIVKSGDTLFSVARAHNLTLDKIKSLNQLESGSIQVGQRLVVSETTVPASTAPVSTNSDIVGVHAVEAGETLYSIAARYNTTVDTLLILNAVDSAYLATGQPISLPQRFSEKVHSVVRGESLSRISRKYKVSITDIKRANGLNNNNLRVGQQLTIPINGFPEIGPAGTLGTLEDAGIVTVYEITYEGRVMASGERYDPFALTVSHRSLPFGTIVLLTNPATERSVFARVNNRGPLEDKFILEISGEVFRQLDISIKDKHQIEIRLVQQ